MVFELVGYYNRILPNVKYSRQLQQWVNTEEEESAPEHEKNRYVCVCVCVCVCESRRL